jgi:hypothetical protein
LQELRRLSIVQKCVFEETLTARIKFHGCVPPIVDCSPQAPHPNLAGRVDLRGVFPEAGALPDLAFSGFIPA